MSESRPSLLAVSTMAPWPVVNGYALRVYHLIRGLAADWQITLLAPPGEAGNEFPDEPGRVDWRPHRWDPAWGDLPDQFDADGLRRSFGALRDACRPQALLLWGGTEYLVEGEAREIPVVADKVDCATLNLWRKLWASAGLRRKATVARTLWRYARYERRAVRAVDHSIVVGEDDARALQRISGRRNVLVVPNGVEVDPQPTFLGTAERPTVIFTGVLRYGPNVDAVRFFAERVWPEVLRRIPEARFVAAGRNPGPEVQALERRPGIEIAANVPDLADALRDAWIATAPMQTGSGIKNKVLEAWAVGRPAVLTPLATNGLDLDDQAATLVAAEPAELAAIVVDLLRDRARREALGQAAWKLAGERHGWAPGIARVARLLAG